LTAPRLEKPSLRRWGLYIELTGVKRTFKPEVMFLRPYFFFKITDRYSTKSGLEALHRNLGGQFNSGSFRFNINLLYMKLKSNYI
jgi:hypothetical protein